MLHSGWHSVAVDKGDSHKLHALCEKGLRTCFPERLLKPRQAGRDVCLSVDGKIWIDRESARLDCPGSSRHSCPMIGLPPAWHYQQASNLSQSLPMVVVAAGPEVLAGMPGDRPPYHRRRDESASFARLLTPIKPFCLTRVMDKKSTYSANLT